MGRAPHRLSGVVVVLLAAACTQSGPTSQPVVEGKTVATASASSAPPSLPDASSTSELEDSPQERTIALQGAPLLTIRRNNAALIEVVLEAQDKDPGQWETIDLERRVVAGEGKAEEPRHHRFTRAKGTYSKEDLELLRRSRQSSKPGTVYGFRARSSGDWSEEVTISVAVPKAPPPSPTALTVQAVTPFATRLRWEADSQRTAGFEIRVASQRMALVNPTLREFVHHRLLPGRVVEYELRAFNSRGVSEPALAKFTVPAQVAATPSRTQRPGPCLPPNFRPGKHTYIHNTVENIPVGNGLVLSLVPGSEASQHFIGKYKGCPREFGLFGFQADVSVVPGLSDEGWPLLHAIAGAGMHGSEIDTLRFSQGHYTIVDRAFFCGEPYPDEEGLGTGTIDQELSLCAPPFDECQMDY